VNEWRKKIKNNLMKLVQTKNNMRGFTLTEILVVIVIAGILAGLTLGLYGRVKSKQIESRLMTEMASIELALENYKAEKNGFPPSISWDGIQYPRKEWDEAVALDTTGKPWANRLYKYLCPSQGRQFLPNGRNSTDDNGTADPRDDDNPEILLSSAPDVVRGKLTKWHYNSYNPTYNKNSYDLWVEYGDYGDDGVAGGGDDIVKVISNWSN